MQVILWRQRLRSSVFGFVNQEAEELLGYPVTQWLTNPNFWAEHIHPEDRARAESCCNAAALEKIPQQFEHRMIAAHGGVLWLKTLVRLVAGEGEEHELVGVMVDVTVHKHAQDEAEDANRVKSESWPI